MRFNSGDFIIQPGHDYKEVYRIDDIFGKRSSRASATLLISGEIYLFRLKRCRLATPEEVANAIAKRITVGK